MLISYRKATAADLDFVVNLYNEIIAQWLYTADTTSYTKEEKTDWFKGVNTPPSGLFIVEYKQKSVGYFYFTPWRKGRAALSAVAEISYYLDSKYHGKGLGKKMITWCKKEAQLAGYKHLLAIMLDSNVRSKYLLEQQGFWIAGHLKHVATFSDRTDGQYLLQFSFE